MDLPTVGVLNTEVQQRKSDTVAKPDATKRKETRAIPKHPTTFWEQRGPEIAVGVVATLFAAVIVAVATGLKDALMRRYRRWRRSRRRSSTVDTPGESFFIVQNTATGYNVWQWFHGEVRHGQLLGAGIFKLAATNTGEHAVEISHVEIRDVEPLVIVGQPIIGVRNRRTNRESPRQPIDPRTTSDVRVEFHFAAPFGRIRKRPKVPADRRGRMRPHVIIRTNFGRTYEVDCDLMFQRPMAIAPPGGADDEKKGAAMAPL